MLVLGAGAAGLMCAAEAGRRGRRAVVLEGNAEPGRKILISGGGRCNFTNVYCDARNFLSENPHFVKSALARYTPAHFVESVKRRGIPFHEKKLGQLFCDRTARDILDLLLAECREGGVSIDLNCRVEATDRDGGDFVVETSRGRFRAPVLVVATGGLSIPKIGATAIGYRIAAHFGIKVIPCRAALVPLTFSAVDRAAWCDLAGVSFEGQVGASTGGFREKVLVTHRGVSGPAILQASSYWKPGSELSIGLVGDPPARFFKRWLERGGEDAKWVISPAGTEGYDKAEVTGGGVDTGELSSKTMEARRVPGLFFIGEVVDVTGHLGGFNFQWAWSSGFAAGQAV